MSYRLENNTLYFQDCEKSLSPIFAYANCLRARRRSVESIQNQRDYGEVQTVSATLDREAATSHTLTVRASDKGSPTSLSSTATVTVTVQDVNDNDTQRDDIWFFTVTDSSVDPVDSYLFRDSSSSLTSGEPKNRVVSVAAASPSNRKRILAPHSRLHSASLFGIG